MKIIFIALMLNACSASGGYSQPDAVEFDWKASIGISNIRFIRSLGVRGRLQVVNNLIVFTPSKPTRRNPDNDLVKTILIPLDQIKCIRKRRIFPLQQSDLVIKLINGRSFGITMPGKRTEFIRLVRTKITSSKIKGDV